MPSTIQSEFQFFLNASIPEAAPVTAVLLLYRVNIEAGKNISRADPMSAPLATALTHSCRKTEVKWL